MNRHHMAARNHGVLAAHFAAIGYKPLADFHMRKMRQRQAMASIRMRSPEDIRRDDLRAFVDGEYEISA